MTLLKLSFLILFICDYTLVEEGRWQVILETETDQRERNFKHSALENLFIELQQEGKGEFLFSDLNIISLAVIEIYEC